MLENECHHFGMPCPSQCDGIDYNSSMGSVKCSTQLLQAAMCVCSVRLFINISTFALICRFQGLFFFKGLIQTFKESGRIHESHKTLKTSLDSRILTELLGPKSFPKQS